ncbi:MAG: hypothetical protein WCD86_01325 [Ktedonobacteraceae bacterium]
MENKDARQGNRKGLPLPFTMWSCRLIIPVLFVVLLAACTTAPAPAPTPTPTSVPATATLAPPTATPTPGALERTVAAYYQALKQQNYALAFSYLDASAIVNNGQRITLSAFTQMARARSAEYGAILSFSISPYAPLSTVLVTRSSYTYTAHLGMKLEQDTWKIISFDRI